jgi:hypothetical protein
MDAPESYFMVLYNNKIRLKPLISQIIKEKKVKHGGLTYTKEILKI